MPDTGQFQIFAVSPLPTYEGAPVALQAVSLRCHRCGAVERLAGEQLQAVEGGTILRCPRCGNRQALSNAHVLDGRTGG